MIHESVLKGYILEELLASLVKSSGYSLIVDQAHDQWALDGGGNGLRVHGRGADHQVDVLGELDVNVQLALPIRLFLEAKCRTGRSDLRDVRNAVGTIDDVNQRYTLADASSPSPPRRYQYKYALASTSGFTKEAVYYAVTHQLSLIDLSDSSAAWLRALVDRIAARLLALAVGLSSFPVGQLREALRRALGTHPDSSIAVDGEDSISAPIARALATPRPEDGLDRQALAEVCGQAAADLPGRLLLGWTSSPFIVFIRPVDDERSTRGLLAAADRQGGRVAADLSFVGADPDLGRWTLEADTRSRSGPEPGRADAGRDGIAEMALWVPRELEPFLIATTAGEERRAPTQRQPSFTVQVTPRAQVTIVYEPVSAIDIDPQETGGDAGDAWRPVRAARWRRDRLVEEPDDPDIEVLAPWSESAYRELIWRLQAEGAVQAAIIQAAASEGGLVGRDSVYQLADRSRDRTLRGITRPATRIARDLIDEGLLHADASVPLWAVYERGVQASHFQVPAEFVDYVDPLWWE